MSPVPLGIPTQGVNRSPMRTVRRPDTMGAYPSPSGNGSPVDGGLAPLRGATGGRHTVSAMDERVSMQVTLLSGERERDQNRVRVRKREATCNLRHMVLK